MHGHIIIDMERLRLRPLAPVDAPRVRLLTGGRALSDGGSVGLYLRPQHRKAELGYWIGRPWWGLGYATEAGRAAVRFGFERLGLNRIDANHIGENPASGRVMAKLGMQYEATLMQDAWHQNRHVDLVYGGILRSEYEASPC